MLCFFLLLPQRILPFPFRFSLFPALRASFRFILLVLEFQGLLCFCANALILQLALDLPLHSLGIDSPRFDSACSRGRTEF